MPKTPIKRDISVSSLDAGATTPDTELSRIRRGIEILIDEEVTAEDTE